MTLLYLDASALVKRYVNEAFSEETNTEIGQAESAGTALVSRAEVVAALAKAVRMEALTETEASESLHVFRREWGDLVRIQVSETIVERADRLAWKYQLRGYDSIHLASALAWQEMLGIPVTLATFDQALWQSAQQEGLDVFPANLDALLQKKTATKHPVKSKIKARK